jgi:hypothetical protein
MVCGALLVAMMAGGFGHYWSVREFVAQYPTTPAFRLLPAGTRDAEPSGNRANATLAANPAPSAPAEGTAQREFFEELLAEVRALRNENRNLIDQVAETNRDMMKVEFRLDTHSESFRPLVTSEERGDTSSFGKDYDPPGVLPPRATPVYPPQD